MSALFEHLPFDIVRHFEFMGWAEEAIAARKAACPERAREIHACFVLLVPVHLEMPEWLYRAHCDEMITRSLDGWSQRDMELATNAEVLMWMSKASLAAPPGAAWASLQEALFRQLAPADVYQKFAGMVSEYGPREPYEGSDEQLLLQLRKRGKMKRMQVDRAAYKLDEPEEPRPAAHSAPLVQQGLWA